MRHRLRAAGLVLVAAGVVLWAALAAAPASLSAGREAATPSSPASGGPLLADVEPDETCDPAADPEACAEPAPPLVLPGETPSRAEKSCTPV